MYRNLEAEIARKQWTKRTLAEKIGMRYNTLISKLNGKSEFTFGETKAIQRVLAVDIDLDTLFFNE